MAGLLSISHCKQRMIATVVNVFYIPNMYNRKTADFRFVFIIFLIYFISSLNYRIVIDLTTYAARSFPEKRKKQNVGYCQRIFLAANWNEWMLDIKDKLDKKKTVAKSFVSAVSSIKMSKYVVVFSMQRQLVTEITWIVQYSHIS